MLTPARLDAYARDYYVNDAIEDIDLEERVQERSLPRILDQLGDARRVLDLGYGTGRIARALLERGFRAEIVEGSPLLCERARRLHAAQGLVVHESLFEAFEPGPVYDGALALHVLEHVDDPRDLLARIHGWLEPGGVCVATVPNRSSLHRLLAVEMGLQGRPEDLSPRDRVMGHQRVYDLTALRRDFEQAGFRVECEFGYFLKPLPNALMENHPPELLDAMVTLSDRLPAELMANVGIRAVRS